MTREETPAPAPPSQPGALDADDPARPASARVSSAWMDGRIIEKDHPDGSSVRLRMHVPDRPHMRPGQHYLIRLRAPDGYTAQRSYSVASDDDDPLLEFLIDHNSGESLAIRTQGAGAPAAGRRRQIRLKAFWMSFIE